MDNSAYYGSDLGSYAVTLRLSDGISEDSRFEVLPGHVTPIVATLYDPENRQYTAEN